MAERRLTRDGSPVDLGSRYFDALHILVREAGSLVSKDDLLAGAWRGVPVTDEALTQGIRMLRRQLGDEAACPQYIETVPKHGYRFIAAVEEVSAPETPDGGRASHVGVLALAAIGGGAAAGLGGGLLYGSVAARDAGLGSQSTFAVVLSLTLVAGMIGGGGIGAGVALAAWQRGFPSRYTWLGGALGGLITGAWMKMLASDAFMLIFGAVPRHITGAGEGALLGAAIGLGAWIGSRNGRMVPGALIGGGLAGALVPMLGGQMMSGSLAALMETFPAAHGSLSAFGRWSASAMVASGALEGALLGGLIVAAMARADRRGPVNR